MQVDDAALRSFRDRRAIRDCVFAYAHAVDRHDEDRIAAVFHPDAIDDHGRYVGGVAGFVAWVNQVHATNEEGHAHNVTTHCCDVDGDTAHAESYVLWVLRHRHDQRVLFGSGRYVDRLERRGGAWRISLRRVIREMRFECDAGPMADLAPAFPVGSWDRKDPAYLLENRIAALASNPPIEGATGQIRRAVDRQSVRDCISRAARAADRADKTLLAEVAYPEAADSILRDDQPSLAQTHNVTTHVASLDSDEAEAVSHVLLLTGRGDAVSIESCRLHDRLRRDDSGWRIASRRTSLLWKREVPAIPLNPDDGPQISRRDSRDISYQRPLSM